MVRWRIITVPLLTVLPFAVAGLIGARHTPSTLPPCLEMVPSVDFDRSPVDGVWLRQIEISNCGGAPIPLSQVEIDSPGHADGFSLLGQAAGHIDVDTPLKLTVGFSPARVGSHSGALRLAIDGRAPIEIGLSGEGIAPGPAPGERSRCTAALPGGFVARGLCSDEAIRLAPVFEPRQPAVRVQRRATDPADAEVPAT